jgi:hypothetical protein
MLSSGVMLNRLYINGMPVDLSGAAFNVYDVLSQGMRVYAICRLLI